MVNLNNLRRRRDQVFGAENERNSANSGNGKNLMRIVEEISNKPSLSTPAETVRREIVCFFRKSERDGVETSSFKLSLLDPLSRKRIKIPVRSVGCDHFQCFDLYNFLEFSSNNGYNNGEEGKSSWHCPHCQNEAKQEQLRIDGYFQEILMRVGPEPLEVEIFPDGSWKEVEQLDFKDVFPVGNADDVVEIVPRKKPKVQENIISDMEFLFGNGGNSLSNPTSQQTTPFAERLRTILGVENGEGASVAEEKIVSAVQKLRQKAATVDRLRVVLGLQPEDGNGESGEIVEHAVLALLNNGKRTEGDRCETVKEQEVGVKILEEGAAAAAEQHSSVLQPLQQHQQKSNAPSSLILQPSPPPPLPPPTGNPLPAPPQHEQSLMGVPDQNVTIEHSAKMSVVVEQVKEMIETPIPCRQIPLVQPQASGLQPPTAAKKHWVEITWEEGTLPGGALTPFHRTGKPGKNIWRLFREHLGIDYNFDSIFEPTRVLVPLRSEADAQRTVEGLHRHDYFGRKLHTNRAADARRRIRRPKTVQTARKAIIGDH